MNLSFWEKTSGTWINVLTVLLGTFVGVLLNQRLPKRMQQILTQGIGLLTLWLGIHLGENLANVKAGRVDGVILGLLAIVLGGIVGELGQIELRLTRFGDWLKERFRGQGQFTEGFVAASLLFCVGPMALIGCLTNGLTGDNTLLSLKATMDGIASIAFSSSYGVGVGFSTLPIAIYQGGLSLAAGLLATVLPDPATHPQVLLTTGVGGLIIAAIGLNLLDIAQIRVASFLPALLFAPLFYFVATYTLPGPNGLSSPF